MARRKQRLLEVDAYIYGHKIGTMIEHQGRVYFQYDPDFHKTGYEISPIKLRTEDITDAYTNPESPDIYHGMAGVFHHSLPDKHGMPFIYRYFERQGLKSNEVTSLDKLTFIADRGMGAIEYQPKEYQSSRDVETTLKAKALHDEMREIREGGQQAYSIDKLMSLINGASPVGGARPKMLITFNTMTKEIRYDNKVLGPGFKRSIIKFDECYPDNEMVDTSIGLTKIEYLHMSLAKECGIDTSKMEMLEEDGEHHLVIERYDRGDEKTHTCSASGLLHKDISVAMAMSYEELLDLTVKITRDQSDVKEMFRRMVFNALSINFDDHAKNFEFMMDSEGIWRLAPAFDITYSKGLLQGHMTTINGKEKDFVMEDFLKVAKESLIDENEAVRIIQVIVDRLEGHAQRAREIGIEEQELLEIDANIRQQLALLDQ